MASNSERQRMFRERQKQLGLTPVTVWVPAAQAAQVQIMAARLCNERNLEIGPLRDTTSGRLVRLER